MKADRLTRLYEGLTNKERAALSFRYMAEGDTAEADRVVDSVPWKNYRCPDMEYRLRLSALFHMASLWAIEFWQAYANKLGALAGIYIWMKHQDHEKAKVNIDAYKLWESRLLALDRALLVVCTEHGIDPDAARSLSETKSYTPTCPNAAPDAKYEVEIRSKLTELLILWDISHRS